MSEVGTRKSYVTENVVDVFCLFACACLCLYEGATEKCVREVRDNFGASDSATHVICLGGRHEDVRTVSNIYNVFFCTFF